jgi:uncharacterized protein (DUF927 family)
LRAAQRFGLIALAGDLAVEFGIAPWEVGSAAGAARWAFDLWLEARGGVIPYEARRAIAQVRHFIEAHGDSRFEDLDLPSDPDRKPVVNRAGFREGKGEDRRWYVPPEVWRMEICTGLDAHDVAKTLADLGMLDLYNSASSVNNYCRPGPRTLCIAEKAYSTGRRRPFLAKPTTRAGNWPRVRRSAEKLSAFTQ